MKLPPPQAITLRSYFWKNSPCGLYCCVDTYAVLTGDLVASRQLTPAARSRLLARLEAAFSALPAEVVLPFAFFRGDSFQGLLASPVAALRTALFLRLHLLAGGGPPGPRWDARLSIGLGPVAYLAQGLGTADGPAFQRSGLGLDAMRGEARLRVHSGAAAIDAELAVSLCLLDAVASRWTPKQAEALLLALPGLRQRDIAAELAVSQPAVSKMLAAAHWEATQALLDRYAVLVEGQLFP